EQDAQADGVGEDDATLQRLGDEADGRPEGEEVVEVDAARQAARRHPAKRAARADPRSPGAGRRPKARGGAFQRLPGTGGKARAVSLDSHRVSPGFTPP